ncbi:MAG: single-stranded-DNA-specific exonuclease RecJ [Enterococcus sp.]
MKKLNYNWQLPTESSIPLDFKQTLAANQLSDLIGRLLYQRGITTQASLASFLHPDLANLHDPYLLFDMEKVVERIRAAIMAEERILIYGDYDADGITSTTVMKETLELLGADVAFYLPNRFTDGYGPNLTVYKEHIAQGVQLILTVDNGVSGHEAIAYANEQGVDVIVTDHHELPTELPSAFGIIHPRHPKGQYPFGDLAGVGVAFKLATALLEEVPVEFLDLVAIGTIADMVSLTDENRILVAFGLQGLQASERLGIQALLKVADVNQSDITEMTVGFTLGPRLNAIGRLGDPNPAVTLLSTFDETLAMQLANEIDMINTTRKKLVETVTFEALQKIDQQNEIHVIAQENWHEGILGIVAGKIVKETGRPTIILTMKENGVAKGSGRSIASFNLFEALSKNKELFASFGGHHSAVGLSLASEQLPVLQQTLNQYVKESGLDLSQGSALPIDEILQVDQVTTDLIDGLRVLAPFGMDNAIPRFLFQQVTPINTKAIGGNGAHLKLSLTQTNNAQQLDVIGFDFGEQLPAFKAKQLNVVGQLGINEWNGNRKPQLTLEDYANEGLDLLDYRMKKDWAQLQVSAQSLVIYFSEHLPKELAHLTRGQLFCFTSIEDFLKVMQEHSYQQVIIAECPLEQQTLKEVMRNCSTAQILLVAYAKDDAYLDGLGTRAQYARLFTLIAKQGKLDVRYKLKQVAQYLEIPEKLLTFMIQVFIELEFVAVTDGILTPKQAAKKELNQSVLYQEREIKIKTEEFVLFTEINTLLAWLAS